MEVDHSQKNANANCFDTEYWGTASLICQRSSGSQPRTCLPWDPVGLSIPKDFNSNLSFRNGAVADPQGPRGSPKEVVHDRNQLIDSPIKSWLFSTSATWFSACFGYLRERKGTMSSKLSSPPRSTPHNLPYPAFFQTAA